MMTAYDRLPPQPAQLSLDDEEAGGAVTWYEHVPVGHPLPEAGDWVWGPDHTHEDGPRPPHTTRYVVVRRGWTFVSPGSLNGQRGEWQPIVRIHVKRDVTADAKVGVVNEP